MALDNILYFNDFIMDIDVTSVGAAENVVFNDDIGFEMTIAQTHNGSATNILFKDEEMQTLTLVGGGGNTYSRSRIVNR